MIDSSVGEGGRAGASWHWFRPRRTRHKKKLNKTQSGSIHPLFFLLDSGSHTDVLPRIDLSGDKCRSELASKSWLFWGCRGRFGSSARVGECGAWLRRPFHQAPGSLSAHASALKNLKHALNTSASARLTPPRDPLTCFPAQTCSRWPTRNPSTGAPLFTTSSTTASARPSRRPPPACSWTASRIPPTTATDSAWACSPTSTATPPSRTPGGTSAKVRDQFMLSIDAGEEQEQQIEQTL